MSSERKPKDEPQAGRRRLDQLVRFSDAFKNLPLRKVEFLCGQGGSIVSVTVKDKHGNLATVDEWAKVLWHMTDEQALAYDAEVGRKPNTRITDSGKG